VPVAASSNSAPPNESGAAAMISVAAVKRLN
jgi:hypothetical protein